MSKTVELLESFGIYLEQSYDKKWCYKWQPYGLDVVIVSDTDKEKAASNFFIELLKSIHYEMRFVKDFGSVEYWLKTRYEQYKGWNDENVNKTIDIANRQFKIFQP